MNFLFLLWKILSGTAIIAWIGAGLLIWGSNYYGYHHINLIIGACFLVFGGFLAIKSQAFSPFLEQKEHKNLILSRIKPKVKSQFFLSSKKMNTFALMKKEVRKHEL